MMTALWAVRRLAFIAASLPAQRSFSSSMKRPASYGFIGLGQMGFRMARNLRVKIPDTESLVIYDVNTSATQNFLHDIEEENASGWQATSVAKDVREVAEKSDTIITSLPEPQHVQSVIKSILSGPLPSLSATRLFIDCSTIDPVTSRALAKDVASASAGAFVDAPMSGGVVGAEAGTLTFMLGAPRDQIERASSVLSFMGKRIVHLGDQGAGLCGKLANNYLLALNNIATAEAMSMGIKWGLDPKALAGMINTSTGKCWPSEVNNPVPGVVEKAPAGRDYEGGFGVSLMAKDLRLALAACKEYDVKLGLGDVALDIYRQAASDERCKGKDFSVVYRWLGGRE